MLPADATQYYVTTSLNSTCVVCYTAFLGYLAWFGHLLHTVSTLPNQPFQMEGGTWPQKDIDMLKHIAPAYCGARFILYLNMTVFTVRNATGTDVKVQANGLQIGHLAISYFCFLFNSRISKYYKPLDPRGLAFVLWSLEIFFFATCFVSQYRWCLVPDHQPGHTHRSEPWVAE